MNYKTCNKLSVSITVSAIDPLFFSSPFHSPRMEWNFKKDKGKAEKRKVGSPEHIEIENGGIGTVKEKHTHSSIICNLEHKLAISPLHRVPSLRI